MFTGIIEAMGRVVALQPRSGDLRVHIATGELDLNGVTIGDSIATNGVCLTVVELPGDGYWADVSRETIAFTTVEQWHVGDSVNLERALTPESRLGGHIVSGHVDGIGEVVARSEDARSIRLTVRAPATLAKYIAHKGSICVDGISLTVNAVNGADFELNIIPHTARVTVIGNYRVGTRVNLEVDVVARYIERLLLGEKAAQGSGGITQAFLAENGFGQKQ
ncbi:MAG: riboflavin synthase [Verrucomicrobiaceae bacterium]|nr:riboflavin synthase [Verrucomicrobiaceae bacterium]